MPMPTLTYPPAHYSYTAARLAKKHQEVGPLAYAFNQEAKRYQKANRIEVTASATASTYTVKKAHCDAINSYQGVFRAHMADWMQQYILSHGGKVDSWPDTATSIVSVFRELPEDEIAFDYFGADYTVFPDGHVGRETPDLVYRNHYSYSAATPYTNLQKEKNRLEQEKAKPKKDKTDTSLFLRVLSLLGALYCVFALFITLGEVFFGIGDSVIALNESAGDNAPLAIGTFLLALPLHLYSFVLAIFSSLSSGVTIAFTVILLGAWVLGAVVCLLTFSSYQAKAKSSAAQWNKDREDHARSESSRKAALQDLANSPEKWEKAQREEEAEKAKKAEMEAFAEEWHRAWFEWARRQKQQAG